MDPYTEELRDLGRGYWIRWLGGLVVGLAAVVAFVVTARPDAPFLVGMTGCLAVVFLSLGRTDLVLGNRLAVGGNAVAAAGWLLLGAAAATGFPENSVWLAFGPIGIGGVVSFYADVGRLFRADGTE